MLYLEQSWVGKYDHYRIEITDKLNLMTYFKLNKKSLRGFNIVVR